MQNYISYIICLFLFSFFFPYISYGQSTTRIKQTKTSARTTSHKSAHSSSTNSHIGKITKDMNPSDTSMVGITVIFVKSEDAYVASHKTECNCTPTSHVTYRDVKCGIPVVIKKGKCTLYQCLEGGKFRDCYTLCEQDGTVCARKN